MSALLQERHTRARAVKMASRELAAGVKAYTGALALCVTSGPSRGYYAPASSGLTGVVVGHFGETIDNGAGLNGQRVANVIYERERQILRLVNDGASPVTAGDRESPCYALDDQTVTIAVGATVAGAVFDVGQGWVDVEPGLAWAIPGGGGGGFTPPASTLANAVLQRVTPGVGGEVMAPLRQAQIAANYTTTLSGGQLYEQGQTVVTPAFTATQNYTPVTATLTDTEGTPAQDVHLTPTAFSSTGTFTKSGLNQTVTFTLASGDGIQTDSKTTTSTWTSKTFVDAVNDPGLYDAAFIASLANGQLHTSNARTQALNSVGAQYGFIAVPSAYGTPTIFIGAFQVTYNQVATNVAVVNAHGVSVNYNVFKSNAFGFGAATLVIS